MIDATTKLRQSNLALRKLNLTDLRAILEFDRNNLALNSSWGLVGVDFDIWLFSRKYGKVALGQIGKGEIEGAVK